MTGSHIAGGSVGAIVGTILVSLGGRIGLDLTNFDSAALGMAAVGLGIGVGHAIRDYGLLGVAGILLHGVPKPTVPQVKDEAGFTLIEALIVLILIIVIALVWKTL